MGRQGDYRTSPERSLVFSATFARYFAKLYDELDQPARWTIGEFGAGEGHFRCGTTANIKRFLPTRFLRDHLRHRMN